mgnify:CR=1 FL=1
MSAVANDVGANEEEHFVTVDEAIQLLTNLSREGYGGHTLICNTEYRFAKCDEKPYLYEDNGEKCISLGGYC